MQDRKTITNLSQETNMESGLYVKIDKEGFLELEEASQDMTHSENDSQQRRCTAAINIHRWGGGHYFKY